MPPDQPEHCLVFILGLSLPLSLILIIMLRRGFSLRPNLTAIIGGLACASAAATLLNFIHPYDAAATDLAVHALAVAIVILANTLFGAVSFEKNALIAGRAAPLFSFAHLDRLGRCRHRGQCGSQATEGG